MAALALGANAPVPDQTPVTELIVQPGEMIAATIERAPARLRIVSGGPDRLLLNADFIMQSGFKPAPLMGNANLNIAGKRAFKGKNRPLDFTIAGVAHKGRAFWFFDAPAMPGDGTIGPWALPQSRITLQFGATDASSQRHDFPLFGGINSSSVTGYKEESFGMAVGFDLDDPTAHPIASAAAGAAIARAYGGTLSGATWDVDILLGVKRPVRLMTLQRPLVIGPLSMTQIAVRVRDRVRRLRYQSPAPRWPGVRA
ncbi:MULTISPECIES: hypothetical protein [unclassified Sphingomonas]|uniref:hypothetical protein n=1 Tax=unclassified Sphingomonas TaxID=196159 RepID=UPI0035A8D972